jgi:hypothetical protein
MQVWVLREFFLAYERLHGIFETKEKAMEGRGYWRPIHRSLEKPMWDSNDPFDSAEGAESTRVGTSLFIVEPQEVK